MFISFFLELRQAGVPTTLKEFLTFLEGMTAHVPAFSLEDFYFFARAALVKEERHLDRFDQVFGHIFKGLDPIETPPGEEISAEIPAEWLQKLAEKLLTEDEKAQIEALGGWDKVMETLKKRLEEQQGRHQGGNKWIGTAGTSPFGAYGYNPEGVRIGQDRSRHRRAIKVWDKREFREFADDIELGTRNIQIAMRRLRNFARQGAATELDMEDTIRSTANNAGYLDLKMVPERHNAVKVLLLLDHGGSMDDHVQVVEELFSAARSELKHLEQFYFHNCLYERIWHQSQDRWGQKALSTLDIINRFPADYKLIFVGDATMSPYEVMVPGGSVEHWNDESGETWMRRILTHYGKAVWINPQPESLWPHIHSIQLLQDIMENRMFPMTLEGLEDAMRALL